MNVNEQLNGPTSKLPLFITWGGDLSKQIASFLHGWLPDLIQAVEPFMSSESIRMGQMWFQAITSRLKVSTFGVAVVTSEALTHPWVHFEVGALAMYAGQDQTAALMVDVAPSELPGALRQIQAASIDDKDDVLKLLSAVNRATSFPLEETRLQRLFDRSWPDLVETTKTARSAHASQGEPAKRSSVTDHGLDEVLGLIREQSRQLASLEARVRLGSDRSIIERVAGPGMNRGPLRRFLRDLVRANPELVRDEMARWFGSPAPSLDEEEEVT
jgi:hypothetical protein